MTALLTCSTANLLSYEGQVECHCVMRLAGGESVVVKPVGLRQGDWVAKVLPATFAPLRHPLMTRLPSIVRATEIFGAHLLPDLLASRCSADEFMINAVINIELDQPLWLGRSWVKVSKVDRSGLSAPEAQGLWTWWYTYPDQYSRRYALDAEPSELARRSAWGEELRAIEAEHYPQVDAFFGQVAAGLDR